MSSPNEGLQSDWRQWHRSGMQIMWPGGKWEEWEENQEDRGLGSGVTACVCRWLWVVCLIKTEEDKRCIFSASCLSGYKYLERWWLGWMVCGFEVRTDTDEATFLGWFFFFFLNTAEGADKMGRGFQKPFLANLRSSEKLVMNSEESTWMHCKLSDIQTKFKAKVDVRVRA